MQKNPQTTSLELVGKEEAIGLSKRTDQSVVILVPGWKDTGKTLKPLLDFLVKENFPAIICSPQPSDGSLTIPQMAVALKPTCVEVVEQTKRPLKLVGFSMGGLIARSYLQECGGAKHCSHLVTIATPHMGVLTALATQKPGLRQMKPNDPWLQKLNASFADDMAKNQINVTSIWSPFDTTIIPPSSSFLGMVKNVRILSPVHALIMRDVRVHKAVGEALGFMKTMK